MAESAPLVSVVIPVYNDPEGIRTTLESVTNQTYPDDEFEIVVADNGSADETLDIIYKFYNEYHDLVSVVQENEIQSSYAARNKGIEKARGEIILFIDADMCVEDTWIESVTQQMQKNKWDFLGCDVRLFIPEGETTIFARYNRLFDLRVRDHIENHNVVPTCSLVVKKRIITEHGDFDERLVSGGDGEFSRRIFEAGYEPKFLADVIMYHPARTTFKALIIKQFRLGRGFEQCRRHHPDRMARPKLVNPRLYLPSLPWKFYSRYRQRAHLYKEEISLTIFVVFYLIGYMHKLIRTSGRIYERATYLIKY